MFIVSLTYTQPVELADKYLDGHYRYIDKYVAAGIFLLVGRKIPRTGGVIFCLAESREELDRIMTEDPFTVHHIGEFEITEFLPERGVQGFENFIAG